MKVYERKSFPRTARDLKTMYEKGNLSFDNAVQRSFVWKNTTKDNRMSMLIDSMIRGLPIPPMYCNCIFTDPSKKIYDFVDGQQRTLTIVKFLKNEFTLINVPTFEDENGNEFDFNGLTFSQLPEEYQDVIKTYSITVYYYENMEQEDVEEMFRRLNNGKALTAIELTRVKATSGNKIRKVSKHKLFQFAMTEKVIAAYSNEDVIIKTWILLYGDKKSFETRSVRPILESTDIEDSQIEKINRCLDLFLGLYEKLDINSDKKLIKKLFNKNNMISLMSVFEKCANENIDIDSVRVWAKNFYNVAEKELSMNAGYNAISKGRAAVTEGAVLERKDILLKSFSDFLERKENNMNIENLTDKI